MKFIPSKEVSWSDVRIRITKCFIEQCDTQKNDIPGNKSELPASFYACGQYIGGIHKKRGWHGTTAALSVILGDYRHYKEYMCGLIAYLIHRESAEKPSPDQSARFKWDNKNVIKQSEFLYTLKQIPDVCPSLTEEKERLIRVRQQELSSAVTKNAGVLKFFLGDVSSPSFCEDIASAFAFRALKACGDIEGCKLLREQLYRALASGATSKTSQTDLATQVLIAYMLTFDDDKNDQRVNELKSAVSRLWKVFSPQLVQDVEHFHEYHVPQDAQQFDYVRIPWQLYLAALLVYWQPGTFWRQSMQMRLEAVADRILNGGAGGGFAYPNSNEWPSTRTYSIIHETFWNIEKKLASVTTIQKLLWRAEALFWDFKEEYKAIFWFIVGMVVLAPLILLAQHFDIPLPAFDTLYGLFSKFNSH